MFCIDLREYMFMYIWFLGNNKNGFIRLCLYMCIYSYLYKIIKKNRFKKGEYGNNWMEGFIEEFEGGKINGKVMKYILVLKCIRKKKCVFIYFW